MIEPLNTEAALATVREALPSMEGHEPNCPCSVGRAHAALDAIASELERVRQENELLKALDEIEPMAELLAELARVRAERDSFALSVKRETWSETQARLDKAVEALREIVALEDNATEHYNDLGMGDVARAALAEIRVMFWVVLATGTALMLLFVALAVVEYQG